jgi:hypothetical protein
MSASYRPARYMSQPTTATSEPSTTPTTNPAEVLSPTPSVVVESTWQLRTRHRSDGPRPDITSPAARENPEHTQHPACSGFAVVLGSGDLERAPSMKLRPRSRPLISADRSVPAFSRPLPTTARLSVAPLRRPTPPKRTGQGKECQRHVADGEGGENRLGVLRPPLGAL